MAHPDPSLRTALPLIVLLLLITSPVVLPALSAEALAIVPPQRESYRIGFALLGGEIPPDDRVARLTFPRLLYRELETLAERDLSEEEISASRIRRRAEAVRAAASSLQSAVDARDALLFAQDATEERSASAAQAVADARALLAELEDAPLEAVPALTVLPILYLDDHAAGTFLAAEDPRSTALANDLDLLVWGSAEEIQGYLAIEIYVYYRFLDRSAYAGSTIVRGTEVSLEVPFVAHEVATVLLGREYGTLSVRTDQADAAIAINGELAGYGEVTGRYLREGEQTVAITAEGFAALERVVSLGAGEQSELSFTLEPLQQRIVRLQSSPAGADVYVNSVWQGRTPLEYNFPPQPSVVRIAAQGYLESRFVVDQDSPSVVSRALLPGTIDWAVEIQRERDDFYQALTWFVLSIPVTIILNGGYESVRGAFPPGDTTLSDEELERLARRGNILYWSSIGGLLVNVGLFVNLAFTIADYVSVGEGAHNQ